MTRSTPWLAGMATAGFVGGLLMSSGIPSIAKAENSPLEEGEVCPSQMYKADDDLICRCRKTEGGNPVWGTDIYTDDSALCHAAVHAGVIPQSGGVVHVRRVAGRDSYQGSTRHGFVSQSYGAYESSIQFDTPQQVARMLGGVKLCPVLYSAALPNWSGDCRCEPGRVGMVQGSNPYTEDSNICGAAVHAGLIGRDSGGVIHVAPGPMSTRLTGSTRNGLVGSNFSAAQPRATFTVSATSQ